VKEAFAVKLQGGFFLLPAWSEIAPSEELWSSVYWYYWVLGVAAGAVTFAIMFYILVKYRAKQEQQVPIEKQKEMRETWKGPIVVFILMGIVLIAVAIQTINALSVYQNPPASSNQIKVRVTGHQFFFSFAYPNNKTSFQLIVPVGYVVILNVTSADVYHQFGIPSFRVKTDAIPGRYNVVWIQPEQTGNYTIQCFELCGVGHATMRTTLVVLSQQSFIKWYNSTGG
jgi:cytochrome c oxidase subunit 2